MLSIAIFGVIGYFLIGDSLKKHEKQELDRLRETLYSL
jgi:hypothetical protein